MILPHEWDSVVLHFLAVHGNDTLQVAAIMSNLRHGPYTDRPAGEVEVEIRAFLPALQDASEAA
jgi:hypothetical protein